MIRIARPASSAFILGLLLCAGSLPARAGFQDCLAELRAAAATEGVSGAVFDRTMRGVEPDPKIIELMNNQPEFKTPIWDYLATLVDAEKVAEGRGFLRRYDGVLRAAEERFGVDRHAVLAVWGVESDFGKISGKWSLPQALSTLACTATRRRDYFRGELMATLKIVQRGDLAPEKLRGSWAGAFGHTQFMPSTYLRLAVDGDGDGRRDLVDSIPDALFSTANYLAKAGWVTGSPWGYEVQVPKGYSGPSGRARKMPLASWSAKGIRRLGGGGLSGTGSAGLLMPAGADGPAFLVFKNYDAAYSYNGADSYALAISLLSDRLKGLPGVQTPWPTDDAGLSRAERRELQVLLLKRGYDVGEPDGAIGAKTRESIADFQTRSGMPRDGRAGQRVFNALKRGG
ncbi:MAG: lytic murein transglycosylase family protein [Hyphomicrobiales bacterium]|nr:lytic murein transglycosylase family protein [Hyphomicrobiales bacterium]